MLKIHILLTLTPLLGCASKSRRINPPFIPRYGLVHGKPRVNEWVYVGSTVDGEVRVDSCGLLFIGDSVVDAKGVRVDVGTAADCHAISDRGRHAANQGIEIRCVQSLLVSLKTIHNKSRYSDFLCPSHVVRWSK